MRSRAFVAIPAASAIGWFGYYYAIYGRFNPSVAYGHYTQMSAGRVPTGILGLLFDQQYGLIVYAPVFAIGAAGLAALSRTPPPARPRVDRRSSCPTPS